MSSNPSSWQWSDTLKQRFYLDKQRNLYFFEDGTTRPGPSSSGKPPPPPDQPRTFPPEPAYGKAYGKPGYGAYQPGTASNQTSSQMMAQLQQMNLGASSSKSSTSNAEVSQLQGQCGDVQERRDSKTGVIGKVATGPNGEKVLLGTSGEQEILDPEYRRRSDPRGFFKVGKVFLTLWTEPSSSNDATVVTRVRFNQAVYTQIRRFVVVREGSNYCNAVPITTYGGRGLAKPDVTPGEHARIYTGDRPPPMLKTDSGILPIALRVLPAEKNGRLDELSRVNLGKIYTIEHNLKVKPFGVVQNAQDLLSGVSRAREQGPRPNVNVPPVGRPVGNPQGGRSQQAAVAQRAQALRMARGSQAEDDEEDDSDDDEEDESCEEEDNSRDKRPQIAQAHRRPQGQQGFSGYQRSQR